MITDESQLLDISISHQTPKKPTPNATQDRLNSLQQRLQQLQKSTTDLTKTTLVLQDQSNLQKQELILIENEQIRNLTEIKQVEHEVLKIDTEKTVLIAEISKLKHGNDNLERLIK